MAIDAFRYFAARSVAVIFVSVVWVEVTMDMLKAIARSLSILFLGIGAASAQTTIIQSVPFQWDDNNPAGITEEFRMYCQEDSPGVVIGAGTLRATIAAPTTQWVNDLTPGDWYCVVTAAKPSLGVESGPSNELAVQVVPFAAPGNLRIP